MKTTLKKVLMYYDSILTDNDIVFYIGKNIYNEASSNKLVGRYYVDNESIDYFSIVLGLAMTTTKRVIIIFEDSYLLRYFNTLLQAGVSKLTNLFFVVLITNKYVHSIKQSTIFSFLKSSKGVLFEAGFLIHTYTKFFNNKSSLKQLKDTYNRIKGPAIGIIYIENNKLSKISNDHEFKFDEFIKFIRTDNEIINKINTDVVLVLKGEK